MRPSWGRLLRLAILALCLAWLVRIVTKLGPERVLEVVARAHAGWLALSFAPLIGRFLIWAVKWDLMMRRQGPLGLRHAIPALLAGNFVNLTTPTAKLAGGFVRAALVARRTGWGMAVSYGWTLADQATNVLGTIALYGVLALYTGLSLDAGDHGAPLLASGAAAVVGVMIVLSLRGWAWTRIQYPSVSRFLSRFTPRRFRSADGATWIRPVLEPALHRGSTWRVAPQDLGLAACSFGSLCLANALALRALDAHAPLLPVAVAVVLGYFAGTFLGLGGIGITEVVLIKLYGIAGVSVEAATAGALLHRASYYTVVLLFGGISFAVQRRGVVPRDLPQS